MSIVSAEKASAAKLTSKGIRFDDMNIVVSLLSMDHYFLLMGVLLLCVTGFVLFSTLAAMLKVPLALQRMWAIPPGGLKSGSLRYRS